MESGFAQNDENFTLSASCIPVAGGFALFIPILRQQTPSLLIAGLIGADGLLPVQTFLHAVKDNLGHAAYYEVLALLWFNAGYAVLKGFCALGSVLALAAGTTGRLLFAGNIIPDEIIPKNYPLNHSMKL